MMDAYVQFIRNGMCTVKNFNFLGDTFLYDPKISGKSALVSIVSSCELVCWSWGLDDLATSFELSLPLYLIVFAITY